tara:strand:+ start:711 stop:926 length:216 start_codon:yes stop_codon:yes gene_type:complete
MNMTWEKIIKRERTELSELISETADIVIDLTLLADKSNKDKSRQLYDKIQKNLSKAYRLEMARFWKEHKRE